jgi:hypothetical protein
MSLNWLWILWPMSGLLAWMWFNHMMTKEYGTARYAGESVLKGATILGALVGGPYTFVPAFVLGFSWRSRECRWGLRFW